MNKTEFKVAYEIAKEIRPKEFDYNILDRFTGFGLLDFEPIYTSLKEVAILIRYQALQLNGEYDNEALGEIIEAGRRKFKII